MRVDVAVMELLRKCQYLYSKRGLVGEGSGEGVELFPGLMTCWRL